LTARTEDADKLADFEAGTDDYVAKPCRSREVIMATMPEAPGRERAGHTITACR
jgi:CheY-like chemotaxis protein